MRNINMLIGTVASALCLLASGTALATTKAEYNAVKDRAKAEYKMAVAKCDGLSGNPKDVCKTEAKAAQAKADAAAEADYKRTPGARRDAVEDTAEADYKVAKEKCDAKTGNDKDICIKEAKAMQTKAKADAKAMQKSTTARNDAAEDKRDAEYKVAAEKCDGMSGDAKDACKKSAKMKYGK